MVIYAIPSVKAAPSLSLSPSSGPPGTQVQVSGNGFVVSATIDLNNQFVTTVSASSGAISAIVTIPSTATNGNYEISVTDAASQTAEAIFTVTGSTYTSTATTSPSTSYPTTPQVTPSVPQSTTYTYPTYAPTIAPVAQSSSFWSPVVIGVIGVIVAVAVILPAAFLLTRSPKRDRMLEREPLPYRSEPVQPVQPPPAYGPHTSRYGQQTSGYQPRYSQYASRYRTTGTTGQSASMPATSSRYSQSAPTVQQPASVGRTCPHCHRAVKGDYSICPYCYKKMK